MSAPVFVPDLAGFDPVFSLFYFRIALSGQSGVKIGE
jgi:hypothetical protein